jgi:hypothetical protein
MFGADDLEWRGLFLHLRGSRRGRALMSIEEAGGRQVGQWRVRYPDGWLSGLMDRAAARAEAEAIALVGLNAARVQASA